MSARHNRSTGLALGMLIALLGGAPVVADDVEVFLGTPSDPEKNLEVGFTDTRVYRYADQILGPFDDNFRRMMVSKTILLRNVRFN